MNSAQNELVIPRKDLPKLSQRASPFILWLHKIFDLLVSSKYNPLYRSGTIAVAMFIVLVVTGIYLLFFYKVGAPHESMVQIVNHVWLGNFSRALHRIATNVAIVATLVHMLQILIQGKTWGARLLAWMSGVIMLGIIFVSAWSGFVMVWDLQGQLFAQAGAKLLSAIPGLYDTMTEAFAGLRPMPSSFFFMNLFLHVALPLLFVIGLLVHTAKIKRTQWFPPRPILIGSLVILVIYSCKLSPPLLPKADLLSEIPRIPVDFFSGFWIPLIPLYGESSVLLGWGLLLLLGLSVPFWWRPKRENIQDKSQVDVARCTGCSQCALDCPYEAISMRSAGEGRKLKALVDENFCVSCGVCAASCDDIAIGVVGNTGEDQAHRVTQVIGALGSDSFDIAIVTCANNPGISNAISKIYFEGKTFFVFPIHCAGTLHNLTMKELLRYAKEVVIWSCPERVCQNRDGLTLFSERLERRRMPFLDKSINRSRIIFLPVASWELGRFLPLKKGERFLAGKLKKSFGFVVVSLLVLTLFKSGAEQPMGSQPMDGILKIAGHIPARERRNCRALTEVEKQTLPKHMQKPLICEETGVKFQLMVKIDETQIISKHLTQKGLKGDRPLYLTENIGVTPGKHKVEISLTPEDPAVETSLMLHYSGEREFEAGKIVLLTPDTRINTFKEN